jgi:N-acetylmuramoyl-L-alanine amidase
MKISALIFLFVLNFGSEVLAQSENTLSVETSRGTYYLPVHQRQGTVYFSIQKLAKILLVNYTLNSETEKIEFNFPHAKLLVTAKNPFLIIISDEKAEAYQLPTSTYIKDQQIFIPLIYSIEILKKSISEELTLASDNKLIIKDKPSSIIVKEEVETPPVLSPSVFDISNILIDEKANGTLIRLKSKKKIRSYSSSYRNEILSVTLKNVNADTGLINKSAVKGLIKQIAARNIKTDLELKFQLGKEYSTHEVIGIEGSNDVLITIHNKIFSKSVEREKIKAKWNFDVIVIDPGHGGKDAGTIGVNGVKEKDINLAIGLKLGQLLENNVPDVKVVYTRRADKFVELYRRGKIANEAGGKLFISIHCNSTPKKPSDANGFEVYLLRPGRTQEAIAIAERENSVIQYEDNPERYQQLTDENFILVSMAHSAYMQYSEKFSDLLNKQFGSDLALSSRGIKQAGFYVLVGASMPSVLIEAGFLSNKKDADYLKSVRGQQDIAQAIYRAIVRYKEYYDKIMEFEI